MAMQVQGKKHIEQTFTGDGYTAHLGFKSASNDEKSLSSGRGRLYMIDKVADANGKLYSRADGKHQLECSLQPLLTHTFSNGLVGSQVLQCMLEMCDMLRDGTLTDIYGQSDAEAGV